MNKKKTYKILNNFPFRTTLSYCAASTEIAYKSIIIPNNDFQKIIDIYKNESLKFLYFNILNIDEECSENLNINFVLNKLSEYFYLSLLVNYDSDRIYFVYPINIINDINNQDINDYKYNKNNLSSIDNIYNSNTFKKIIKSKIVHDLIYNFKGTDDYDDKGELGKKIRIIENYNNKIINENISVFKELNLIDKVNDYKLNNIKIDKIYIEIIIYLIKNKKLEDYEYTFKIMEELDLKFIDLTKKMFEELIKVLNENNNYIKEYIIINIDDLLNIKKINFYYILLRYIIKDSLYIYQIPFLLKTRKKIIKIINSNLKGLLSKNFNEDNNDVKSKFVYILKTLTDFEYYYFKCIKYKLNEILNYFKNFYIKSKAEDIKLIEEEIRKKQINISEKYLPEFNKAQKINKRAPIIKYLYNEKYTKQNINNKEEIFEDIIKLWNSLEKIINDKEYEKINIEYKQILIEYFKNEENKDLLLEIFNKDIYNDFIQNNNNNNIDNKKLENSIQMENDSKSEIIIQSNKKTTNQNSNEKSVISNLDKEEVKNDIIPENESNSDIKSNNDYNLNHSTYSDDIKRTITNETISQYKTKKDNSIKIIQFNKILNLNDIDKNKENDPYTPKTLDFIKKAIICSETYYFVGGLNNNLYIYNNNFELKKKNKNKRLYL